MWLKRVLFIYSWLSFPYMGWFPINPFSNKSPLLCLPLTSPSFPPSLLLNTKKKLCPFLVLFWGLGNPSEQNYQKESLYKFPFWILPLYSMKPPFMKPSSQIASHPIPLLPPQSPPPFFPHQEENELCSHCHSMGWIVLKYKINWKWFWVLHHPLPSHPIKFPYNKPPSLIPRREATESNKFLAGLLESSWYCLN